MKHVILLLSIVCCLIGCACKNKEQVTENSQSSSRPKIIVKSKNEPLPPVSKKPQSMKKQSGPQNLPNVDLNKPVILREMPGK